MLLALGVLLLTVNALGALGIFTPSLPAVAPAAAVAGGLILGAGMVMAKG